MAVASPLAMANLVRLLTAVAAALAALAASPPASAGELQSRWIGQLDVIGRYNPEGIMLLGGVALRKPFSYDKELRMDGAYLQGGIVAGVNPAYGQVAAYIEYMPWLPLVLRAQSDIYGFFGANGALLSFADASGAFGRGEIASRSGSEEVAMGHRLLLQPTLRAMLGPVVLRNQTDLARYGFGGEGPYYYEWEYDTLLRNQDWVISNRTAILLRLWHATPEAVLFAGPMYEVTHAKEADLTRHRLALSGYFVPADSWAFLRTPRLYAQAGINLGDPNRQGEPFLIVGAGSDFDLAPRE